MNASQKKGLGLLISIVIFGAVSVASAFGAPVPSWVATASDILTLVSGFFGVLVQNPFSQAKS